MVLGLPIYKQTLGQCKIKNPPIEEATKLVSQWDAVTVVGARDVGLARQLVQADDLVARVQHQQYQGHPHSQARETQTSFSSRILFSLSL